MDSQPQDDTNVDKATSQTPCEETIARKAPTKLQNSQLSTWTISNFCDHLGIDLQSLRIAFASIKHRAAEEGLLGRSFKDAGGRQAKKNFVDSVLREEPAFARGWTDEQIDSSLWPKVHHAIIDAMVLRISQQRRVNSCKKMSEEALVQRNEPEKDFSSEACTMPNKSQPKEKTTSTTPRRAQASEDSKSNRNKKQQLDPGPKNSPLSISDDSESSDNSDSDESSESEEASQDAQHTSEIATKDAARCVTAGTTKETKSATPKGHASAQQRLVTKEVVDESTAHTLPIRQDLTGSSVASQGKLTDNNRIKINPYGGAKRMTGGMDPPLQVSKRRCLTVEGPLASPSLSDKREDSNGVQQSRLKAWVNDSNLCRPIIVVKSQKSLLHTDYFTIDEIEEEDRTLSFTKFISRLDSGPVRYNPSVHMITWQTQSLTTLVITTAKQFFIAVENQLAFKGGEVHFSIERS